MMHSGSDSMAVAYFRFLTPFFFVFLGACVTPPVRGSDILGARLCRIPSKTHQKAKSSMALHLYYQNLEILKKLTLYLL